MWPSHMNYTTVIGITVPQTTTTTTSCNISSQCCSTVLDCCCNNLSIAGVYYCKSCIDTTQSVLHDASAVMITCIDFRLADNIVCQMNNLNLKNNYDEFILAGTSLGYNGLNGSYPNWAQAADDHITIAYNLHHISTIILIDHMQCGAYKVAYTELVNSMGTVDEYNLHKTNLNTAAYTLMSKFGPGGTILQIHDLSIKKYIISIDGGTLIDIDAYGTFPF